MKFLEENEQTSFICLTLLKRLELEEDFKVFNKLLKIFSKDYFDSINHSKILKILSNKFGNWHLNNINLAEEINL